MQPGPQPGAAVSGTACERSALTDVAAPQRNDEDDHRDGEHDDTRSAEPWTLHADGIEPQQLETINVTRAALINPLLDLRSGEAIVASVQRYWS